MIVHPALDQAFNKTPWRYAALSEYARVSGLRPDQVLESLEEDIDAGHLKIEIVGSEVFVHTAPRGRFGLANSQGTQFPANLWEMLRERAEPQTAYVLWRLARQLELHGWIVEAQTSRIRSGLGALDNVAHLGFALGQAIIPILVFPTPDSLSLPQGLLTEYASAGASAVAVVCDAGALDPIVVAVREWTMSRAAKKARVLNVLICEAPNFSPVLLTPGDTAVQPVSLTSLNHPDAWKGGVLTDRNQPADSTPYGVQ